MSDKDKSGIPLFFVFFKYHILSLDLGASSHVQPMSLSHRVEYVN